MLRVLVIAAVFVGVAVSQSTTCAAQTSLQSCVYQTQSGLNCIWNAVQSQCVIDPCTTYGDVNTCAANGCIPLPWNAAWSPPSLGQQGPTCVSTRVVCNEITVSSDCASTSFCQYRDGYCASVQETKPGTSTTSCDVNFPGWSVALIIIWLCIMIVLGFIIFLIVSKGKQQAVRAVEHSEVVVDSLHLRDNFNLQQPLAHNAA
jgi:hypothetical protein